MSGLRFGIVSTSLWRSRRWRKLTSQDARLVYFYLQTSPYHTSIGAFSMPSALVSSDTGLNDVNLAEDALRDLEEVGLIHWDHEEEVVVITNFLEHRAPTSRKHLAGIIRALDLIPKGSSARPAAAVELVCAIFKRAQEWTDPKAAEARAGFMEMAVGIIKREKIEERLADPDLELPIDLLEALGIDLSIKGKVKGKEKKGGVGGEGGGKVEGEVEFEEEREEENQNVVSSGPAGSPPAKSGRQPDDIQADIAELTRKAAKHG